MRTITLSRGLRAVLISSGALMAACSAGGGGDGGGGDGGGGDPAPTPTPTPTTGAFETPESTARFLTQATFGPTPEDLDTLTGTSASAWFRDQLAAPPSVNLDTVLAAINGPNARNDLGDMSFETKQTPGFSFWTNAVEGNDQLRQRTAFALSQILVISHQESTTLFDYPATVASYQDVLVEHAFGNYRDLLEAVTFTPAMAEYLTYLQNQRGDPETGRMPDENYAREIMQLFTIGLEMLQINGEPVTDGAGEPIETYDNDDVSGLARVFTGLSTDQPRFFSDVDPFDTAPQTSPLRAFPAFHSELEKSFLGATIPAGTGPEASIDQALDILFAHPNVAPFLSRQLIQRFVTSDPEPDYVARVAQAFEAGAFTLPDGQAVGTGARGDLAATLAAILFDPAAREDDSRAENDFGKVREPVIRFVNWARAFDAETVTPRETFILWNTSGAGPASNGVATLNQHPYKSPSVFNFYRPGYVAPGTETGAAGLTVPELQLVNANTVAAYNNFMAYFTFAVAAEQEIGAQAASFIPDYTAERALADDPAALVDHLDLLLSYGDMSEETKQSIIDAIALIPLSSPVDPEFDGPAARVGLAVLMAMNAPDYLVQR